MEDYPHRFPVVEIQNTFGHPVYWRLHGVSDTRHSYSDRELQRLAERAPPCGIAVPAFVMFNNLPRVRDAKRFMRLVQ